MNNGKPNTGLSKKHFACLQTVVTFGNIWFFMTGKGEKEQGEGDAMRLSMLNILLCCVSKGKQGVEERAKTQISHYF